MSDLLKKNHIIWDLDNTLYRQSPELHEQLDNAMAKALIEDLGVNLEHDVVKQMVKDSYRMHRDGGYVFYKDYDIDEIDLYKAYHRYVPIGMLEPYKDMLQRLQNLSQKQFVFTASPFLLAKNALKKLGLYDFFKGNIYSIEDFDYLKKNETPNVYYFLTEKIGADAKDCIFVDDSYSNLKYSKQIGMTTVWLSSKEEDKKEHYIDYVFKNAPAFLDAIEQSNKSL